MLAVLNKSLLNLKVSVPPEFSHKITDYKSIVLSVVLNVILGD